MAPIVIQKAEGLWETWNIRVCILFSLFIQASLTFLAPWRKSQPKLRFVIWLWYLMADAIALYTIGLISYLPKGSSKDTVDLLVLWSPFLLVHLGGPDTITALALEDNELWLRHLLQFATQGFGTLYLFYKTRQGDELLIPTIIMFFDGFVKYLERTISLYMASKDNVRRNSVGYTTIPLADYFASQEAAAPDDGPVEQEESDEEMELVKKAHKFYKRYRGLIANTTILFEQHDESRSYFLRQGMNGKKAFKVIEIELNFFYYMFYTKVNILIKAKGTTRVFSFAAVITSLILFLLKDKTKYNKVDVSITYVLLVGALIMDVIAVIMLSFSDWAVVMATNNRVKDRCMPCVSTTRTLLCWWLQHRPPRWSEKIPQYDLLYACNKHPMLSKILFIKCIEDIVTNMFYVTHNEFDEKLGNLIFKELLAKASWLTVQNPAEAATRACKARGDLIFGAKEYADHAKRFEKWTTGVDYDQSLFDWHIATKLSLSSPMKKDDDDGSDADAKMYRDYSKMLSDYMMHFLIMQPAMASAVAGIAHLRLQNVFNFETDAGYEPLLVVTLDKRPRGSLIMATLGGGRRLRMELDKLGEEHGKEIRWKVTFKIWVELLCYAAAQCAPTLHLQQLSQGGNLITLVWLLMVNLGLRDFPH